MGLDRFNVLRFYSGSPLLVQKNFRHRICQSGPMSPKNWSLNGKLCRLEYEKKSTYAKYAYCFAYLNNISYYISLIIIISLLDNILCIIIISHLYHTWLGLRLLLQWNPWWGHLVKISPAENTMAGLSIENLACSKQKLVMVMKFLGHFWQSYILLYFTF